MLCDANNLHPLRLRMKDPQGFTLLEVILVLVLIGIVTVAVASRFSDNAIKLSAATEVLKSHLRYAQIKAMSTDTPWYVQVAGGGYALYRSGDGSPRYFPGEERTTVPLDGMSVTLPGSSTIGFDAWGSPFLDAAATTPQTADRTVTVSDGTATRQLVITANTGFIQ